MRRVTHPAHSTADAPGSTRGARAVFSTRPYVTAGGTGSALSVPAAPAQCARTPPTHGYLPETRKQPPRPRRFHTNSRRECGVGMPSRAAGQPTRSVASSEDGCLCEDRGNVGP